MNQCSIIGVPRSARARMTLGSRSATPLNPNGHHHSTSPQPDPERYWERDTWTKRFDISFKRWVASWPLLIGGCKTGTLSRRLFNLFLLKLNAIPNCNHKSLQDFGCFDVSMYHVSCKLLCEYYYIKTVITKSAMYHNFKKNFKVFYHSIMKSIFSVQSFAFCRPMC